jgi:hypothetical protein
MIYKTVYVDYDVRQYEDNRRRRRRRRRKPLNVVVKSNRRPRALACSDAASSKSLQSRDVAARYQCR